MHNFPNLRGSFPSEASSELRLQLNKNRGVTLIGGAPSSNYRTEASGCSARVYRHGVWGFSSSPETTEAAARAVLDAAAENARFMDERIAKGKPSLPNIPRGSHTESTNISDPEQAAYSLYLRELDELIAKKYPSLKNRTLSVRADSTEKNLITSDGYQSHSILPRCYVYIFLTEETKDGTPIELFTPVGGCGTFDKLFTDPALLMSDVDALYEKLMAKREGVFPDAGEKTVILGGELSGMLAHEAVGHTVEADLVLGGSVAAHNLGKTVASTLVTMTDFANTAFGESAPLPVYVDDEGVPAEDELLIKDGVLVGYMNSRESAAHFGMTPHGSSRAYGYSDEPLIRMRNTAIHPGTSTLEEMIESVEDGYYLIDTNNGQADTTGEFMFGVCMGYEIKHGRLGRAILDTTISGVAFDMLKTVDMVGDTVSWSSSGYCGKKQPMAVGLGGPAIKCKVTMGGR
jgi:TldD protein